MYQYNKKRNSLELQSSVDQSQQPQQSQQPFHLQHAFDEKQHAQLFDVVIGADVLYDAQGIIFCLFVIWHGRLD